MYIYYYVIKYCQKLKSILHTIICVFVPLYDYRDFLYKDFWKNNGIKKIYFKSAAILHCTAAKGSLFKPGRFKRFQLVMKVVFLFLRSPHIILCCWASETMIKEQISRCPSLLLHSCWLNIHFTPQIGDKKIAIKKKKFCHDRFNYILVFISYERIQLFFDFPKRPL